MVHHYREDLPSPPPSPPLRVQPVDSVASGNMAEPPSPKLEAEPEPKAEPDDKTDRVTSESDAEEPPRLDFVGDTDLLMDERHPPARLELGLPGKLYEIQASAQLAALFPSFHVLFASVCKLPPWQKLVFTNDVITPAEWTTIMSTKCEHHGDVPGFDMLMVPVEALRAGHVAQVRQQLYLVEIKVGHSVTTSTVGATAVLAAAMARAGILRRTMLVMPPDSGLQRMLHQLPYGLNAPNGGLFSTVRFVKRSAQVCALQAALADAEEKRCDIYDLLHDVAFCHIDTDAAEAERVKDTARSMLGHWHQRVHDAGPLIVDAYQTLARLRGCFSATAQRRARKRAWGVIDELEKGNERAEEAAEPKVPMYEVLRCDARPLTLP
jgi:hypothetical protein